jgi:hypothetical protein
MHVAMVTRMPLVRHVRVVFGHYVRFVVGSSGDRSSLLVLMLRAILTSEFVGVIRLRLCFSHAPMNYEQVFIESV